MKILVIFLSVKNGAYRPILGSRAYSRAECFSEFRIVHENIRFFKICHFFAKIGKSFNLRRQVTFTVCSENGHFLFQFLITQREIFLLRNIRYGMATILCWFLTILTISTIFGTKIQRSFKFLEGVMIYNYTSGLLLDYCFDLKFTHFEPFSLFLHDFRTFVALSYPIWSHPDILIVNLGSVKGSPV